MRSYRYEALDGNGNLTTGLRVAEDEDALHQYFQQQGLTPVSLQKQTSFWTRPIQKKSTLARFFRNLSLFLDSGMELLPALEQVSNRLEEKQIAACVETVIDDLKNGRSFGDALRSCEPYFPPSAHRICSVGEETGNLKEACEELSEYFESQNEFMKNIYSMMLYPFIVIGVGFIVLLFLVTTIVPRLRDLIPEDQSLPMISKIVFSASDMLQGWGLTIIGATFVGIASGAFLLYRSEWGQRMTAKFLDSLTIYRKIKIQLFSLAMAMCTRVGLDMTRALSLGNQVLGNPYMQERMKGVIEDVRRGHTLTDSLSDHEFDLIPLDSLQAGEQSGNLESVFRFHATLLEEEIDESLSRLITYIEPLVTIIMASFVAAIMLAVMLPIMQLSSGL
ncbi:MAG: type II secretion system F family protein [bacterium]